MTKKTITPSNGAILVPKEDLDKRITVPVPLNGYEKNLAIALGEKENRPYTNYLSTIIKERMEADRIKYGIEL